MNAELFYQIIAALVGLGVLLFGIKLLNSSLESVLGRRFKESLGRASNSKIKNYAIGAGTTFLMQTSVLTITMTTGLINIGAIGLVQAFCLVLGANLGSSLSLVLIAFQNLSILKIFSILCLIGMIIQQFIKNPKGKIVSNTLLGFGLLCFGIDTLGGAMSALCNLLDLQLVISAIQNPFVLILLGFVLALIMQSGYAVIAILIAVVSAGAMSFLSSVYVLLGCNIGSATAVMFLTNFGDGTSGKKVVVFNLIFKIFAVIFIGLLTLVPSWVDWIYVVLCGKLVSVAIFVMDTIISLIPGLIALLFVSSSAKLMNKIIKQKKQDRTDDYLSFEIDDRVLTNPAIAFKSVKNCVAKILELEIKQNQQLLNVLFSDGNNHQKLKNIKGIERAIKLTTNNTIRVGAKFESDNMARVNALINILNCTSQILKINQKFDFYSQELAKNPKLLLKSQKTTLYSLGEDINGLGDAVCGLLQSENINLEEKLNVIFEINDKNIGNNTKAKHELLAKKSDGLNNEMFLNILYEFGKLETNYTDIAIKNTLMEE